MSRLLRTASATSSCCVMVASGGCWPRPTSSGALDCDVGEFLAAVEADPVEVLGLGPLVRFRSGAASSRRACRSRPCPPFASSEASGGVSLRAVPAAEQHASPATFARAAHDTEDGGQVTIVARSPSTSPSSQQVPETSPRA
jgi:hypothetical protein